MEKTPFGCGHSFAVSLGGSYLYDSPEDPPFIAVALHGYGQTPDQIGGYARQLLGERPAIAAIQGPHPHYLDSLPSVRVGYNWGTSADWPAAIELHHRILLTVLEQLPKLPILLMGFSQPVGLNYRFVASHPGRVAGVLALCGGVPREWAPDGLETPIFHVARSEDEYYPLTTAQEFESRLRQYASDVEFHLIPGRHRYPSTGRSLIRAWIGRIFHLDIGDSVPK